MVVVVVMAVAVVVEQVAADPVQRPKAVARLSESALKLVFAHALGTSG